MRLLLAAYRSRSLSVAVLTPAQFAARTQAGWSGEAQPASALLRLPSGVAVEDLAALCVASQDVTTRWIDPPERVSAVHDKARCLALLARAGLPVPPTVVVRRDDAPDLSELPGEAFVVKPNRGSSGRGVTVGLGREDAARRASAFAELCGPALIQPLLGGGIDRRLLVLGGQVVAAMERVPAGADGRANTVYGASARSIQPNAEECRLAIAAAEVTGLLVAGVDLLKDGDRHVLLEVNTCPGLVALGSASGVDVGTMLVNLVLSEASFD
jgi:ribosomal protein S6--L-glutamate ligase